MIFLLTVVTEMGDDVYESLPEGTTVGVTLVAGAMAGIMEHCVMFPVDCVKVRIRRNMFVFTF